MHPTVPAQVSTGVAGLNRILHGGLPVHEMYLVTGEAGTGKTTLALQFMRAGLNGGQRVLYLSLSQSAEALRKIAASHGWSLEGVTLEDWSTFGPTEQAPGQEAVFRNVALELRDVISQLFALIERVQPERLVVDSLLQLRPLASNVPDFQRQLFALGQHLASKRCTTLLIDAHTGEPTSQDIQDLTHGVLRLERWAPEFGNVRRRLLVLKMRGLAVHGGYHHFTVGTGGLEVYPRLAVGTRRDHLGSTPMASGLSALDTLLGGGLEAGTAVLLLGATGTGKTSLATLYVHAAAQQGKPGAVFIFEERLETFFMRAASLNLDLRPFVDKGLVTVQQINAGDLSAGEFSDVVRRSVDEGGARVVLIDSLSGYFHAMPQEQQLLTQMHELLNFLAANGVLSLLVAGQHGLAGPELTGPLDISYLCDTLLLLRHFDAGGTIRKAVAVTKKRTGPHEHTIRELYLEPGGIRVGEPLRQLEGLLTGAPHVLGAGLTGDAWDGER
ncbi:MAG: AAA family ATPase [Verrucomicrobia bacterium]|nr:AAA family ATPase [Verrucomicrobiota bacterium]